MRDEQHYRNMLARNPHASVGVSLAAAAVYAARFGQCEAEHHGTNEFASINRQLRSHYGEQLTVSQVRTEMDRQNRDITVRVRLTAEERERLQSLAGADEISISEYMRRRLFQ